MRRGIAVFRSSFVHRVGGLRGLRGPGSAMPLRWALRVSSLDIPFGVSPPSAHCSFPVLLLLLLIVVLVATMMTLLLC